MRTHNPALFRALCLISLCSLNRVTAQDKPAAQLPEFEVASVKAVDPGIPHMVGIKVYTGGRVVLSCMPLKAMIAAAFRLSYWQISGGEAWTANSNYDVDARPSTNLGFGIADLRYTLFGIEDERLREMLQALLIDRFQMKFHRGTKTGDVYLLERSGKEIALRQSERPSESASPAADRNSSGNDFGSVGYAGARWVIAATTLPQLAKFASDFIVHAPVVDRTRLSGSFDYKQPEPDQEPNYSDNADSFLRLIPGLGLRMVRTKGPVEKFVIDQAEKPLPN